MSGYDNFELFGDSTRYDNLSQRILEGDGNMDIIAYLAAPLYPYTLALIKYISGEHWQIIAVSYQFTLVSLSAVYIYRIGHLLWADHHKAMVGSIIYILYPMTLWYNFTLAQETTFQGYFILFIYYFLKSCQEGNLKDTIFASILFSLALLTKSHILLLVPFLAILLLLNRRLQHLLTFLIITLLICLPHGLKNLKEHDVFTISSHGNASLFILGHNDITYDCLFSENKGRTDKLPACDPTFVFDKSHIYPEYGKVNALSPAERNSKRWHIALEWIKDHPKKFAQLKGFGLKRFLIPGLDKNQYPIMPWLASLLIGLLIYIPGYLSLAQVFRKNIIMHGLMPALVLICFVIFFIFFPINRFRVITMEPLLCVYAGRWYVEALRNLKKGRP